MLIALGALLITSLLITAFFVAIQGDVHDTRHDLDGKRAYAAALAGANAFLYQINQNSNYWQTCSNDVAGVTSVQGSTTGEQYSYTPIFNSGYNSANCSTNPIGAMVDPNTGTLRYEFTGYSGNPQVKRTVVSSFTVNTPLDYLWYTQYETLDSSISGYGNCGVYYRNGRPSTCPTIDFITGDVVKGPMYTQDQFSVSGSPTFGRDANDEIASEATTAQGGVCIQAGCGSAVIKGTLTPNAGIIPIPTDNSQLETDANSYGKVYPGTTTITLNGTTATVMNCPGTTATSAGCTGPSTVDLTQDPIIYVQNASGCTPYNYSPFNVSYNATSSGNYYGCSGDVYVSGSYTTPVTIAAANNIILDGNVTTNSDGNGDLTGTATLALVANRFVRLMHGVTTRESSTAQDCTAASGRGNVSNISSQSLSSPTIDAAILAIQHSFIVDNYDCGSPLGTLTLNGAMAQDFRGTVGMFSGSTVTSGYSKAYTYDDRLKVLLPPFLFDISHAGWRISRETLCTPGGSSASTAC